MKMEFNDSGTLAYTDYWANEAGAMAGAVWVAVRENSWHILMPDVPTAKLKKAVAMPVTARDEPQGWQWKLWLKPDVHWSIHVPLENFLDGKLPCMPVQGTFYETSLQYYGTFLPGLDDKKKVTYNFGHFDNDFQVPRLRWQKLLVARAGKKWRSFILGMMEVEAPREKRAGD